MTRVLLLAPLLAACTQSAPPADDGLAELTAQLEQTNAQLAEIVERLDSIESHLDAREAASRTSLERMRAARRDGSDTPSPEVSIDSKKLDEGIQCADDVCKLKRSLLEEILANPTALAKSARVVPAMENGEPHGLKLYGMRPGTIPARLGLENGDRLVTVNGFALDSPDKALEAYATLRTVNRLTLAIERKGKPHELTIEIQ